MGFTSNVQIKIMRGLQYFPVPEDSKIRSNLMQVLQRILESTEVMKNVNRNNAMHAVLFEAVALVMHLDSEQELVNQVRPGLGNSQ